MRTTSALAGPVLALAVAGAIATPVAAKSLSAAEYIARDELEQGTRNYVAAKLKYRPYFMGTSDQACTAVTPVPAGFENVAVVDCTYIEGGLTGWVRVAVPGPDLVSDWILKAAALCKKPEACAAQLATNAWLSNQYSFPIAGNIIEPADASGGVGPASTNLIFINGVTVVRPGFLSSTKSLAIDDQKQCALTLLAVANGETPSPVPGDTAGTCSHVTSTQVSRPAAIRQDIYVDYGDPAKTKADRQAKVGSSCPPSARKVAWLAITRSSFVTGAQTRDHPLFDTAARAFDAGVTFVGRKSCT